VPAGCFHFFQGICAWTAILGATYRIPLQRLTGALRNVRSGCSLPELATEELRASGSPRSVVVREAGSQAVQVDCDTRIMVAATRQGILHAIATE
jgi:hypothetical protein